jgi:uncharacterized repeat protein (TIGR01451 family)
VPAGIVGAVVASAFAHAGDVAGTDHILYVPLPTGTSEAALSRADAAARARLDAVVAQRLRARHGTRQRSSDDAIVIFTRPDGQPILPDLAAARRTPSRSTAASAARALTFTFDSPLYPWTAEDVGALSAALDAFYPTAEALYGPPAFAITVNVRRDPTIGLAGEYNASSNEMILARASDLTVLCHEMIHAFRDDAVVGLSSFEEGMTRAAEVEVFNRLAPAYEHTFDQNHGNAYDVYYEGLNRPAIGARGGAFFSGYVSPLVRYQLAGYAWGKGLLENPDFLADFNARLYDRLLNDPATQYTESKLVALAAAAQPTLEGEPFEAWYAKQSVLGTDPPAGYLLYQRINQFTVDFFSRDGATGHEVMQPNAPIEWALYDDRDELIGNGIEITSANGFVDFAREAFAMLAGHAGRVKVVALADTPAGPIANVAWRTAGPAHGVFGVVADATDGLLTIVPIDDVASAVTVAVAHGAFAAPSLAAAKGRFVALFSDASGWTRSKTFTKDASDYFVLIGPAETTADLGIEALRSRKIVKNGATLTHAFTVRNAGPDEASDVEVIARLPEGVRLVAATGGACTGPTARGLLICMLGRLESLGSRTVAVTVEVTAPRRSVLRTTAAVSATSTDPVPSNDAAAAATRVVGRR